jgi:adenylate kinase family enzyme
MNKIPRHEYLTNIPTDMLQIALLAENKNAVFVSREFTIGENKILTIDAKLPRYKEDELYYDANIRLLVPRGLCYIFVNDQHVHTLYGHPKFGNYGDYTSGTHDMESILSCARVFRRKENGECAHWSAFKHNEIIYEVYGSKNVHIVIRFGKFSEDIELYKDERYMFATKMAKEINRLYGKKSIEYFLDTGYTFCAEACFPDSQHIVNYGNVEILFFAVTGKRDNLADSIVKVSPLIVDELFRSYDIKSVTETIIIEDKSKLAETEKYFETQDNSEGAVVSCVDEKYNVIYVYKHKNYNYIFIRALREQMRKNSPTTRIIRRFEDLHIKHPSYDVMVNWALHFNAWYRTLNEKDKIGFFDQFVTNMNKFNLLIDVVKEEILMNFNKIEKDIGTLYVIIFVAIPGSGKSFLARALKTILETYGQKVVHLEQDMFFSKGKNAGKEYDNAIKKSMNESDINYLILTKSNHSTAVRNKTYEILSKCNKNTERTYVVMTADEGDMKKTFEICTRRILERGFAHASLFGKNESELKSILGGIFIKQWQPLTDDEMSYNIVNIDIEDDKYTIIKSCIEQLQKHEIVQKFELTDKLVETSINRVVDDDMRLVKNNIK